MALLQKWWRHKYKKMQNLKNVTFFVISVYLWSKDKNLYFIPHRTWCNECYNSAGVTEAFRSLFPIQPPSSLCLRQIMTMHWNGPLWHCSCTIVWHFFWNVFGEYTCTWRHVMTSSPPFQNTPIHENELYF